MEKVTILETQSDNKIGTAKRVSYSQWRNTVQDIDGTYPVGRSKTAGHITIDQLDTSKEETDENIFFDILIENTEDKNKNMKFTMVKFFNYSDDGVPLTLEGIKKYIGESLQFHNM